jgi:hypothetical protein
MTISKSQSKLPTTKPSSIESHVTSKTFLFRVKRLLVDGVYLEANDVEDAKRKMMDYLITEIAVATENHDVQVLMRKPLSRAERAELRSRGNPDVMAVRTALWTALEMCEYENYVASAKTEAITKKVD